MRIGNRIEAVVRGIRKHAVVAGDCVFDARAIPSQAVDSVVVDPPYGMKYKGLNNNRPAILNDERPFIWFLPEAYRVLKPGGALVCFCQWKGQEDFKRAIELAGFKVMSHVIWDRMQHGMGHTGCTFGPRHDVIWFAVKGSFRFPQGRPASVFQHANVAARSRAHSTQKPVSLMRQLIEAVTPKGGLVYDPCCGSGSTGVAAVRAGYRFIGMDLDPANVATAIRRIETEGRIQAKHAPPIHALAIPTHELIEAAA